MLKYIDFKLLWERRIACSSWFGLQGESAIVTCTMAIFNQRYVYDIVLHKFANLLSIV
jgi:hypothetical protein